jgi:hypothetical protein
MTFKPHHDREHLYFVTATVLAWIPLFPVVRGWQLAEDRTSYAYSSAGYYDRGERPEVPVTDVGLWWYGEG